MMDQEGQKDLLSAALNECGLGDFFSNSDFQDDDISSSSLVNCSDEMQTSSSIQNSSSLVSSNHQSDLECSNLFEHENFVQPPSSTLSLPLTNGVNANHINQLVTTPHQQQQHIKIVPALSNKISAGAPITVKRISITKNKDGKLILNSLPAIANAIGVTSSNQLQVLKNGNSINVNQHQILTSLNNNHQSIKVAIRNQPSSETTLINNNNSNNQPKLVAINGIQSHSSLPSLWSVQNGTVKNNSQTIILNNSKNQNFVDGQSFGSNGLVVGNSQQKQQPPSNVYRVTINKPPLINVNCRQIMTNPQASTMLLNPSKSNINNNNVINQSVHNFSTQQQPHHQKSLTSSSNVIINSNFKKSSNSSSYSLIQSPSLSSQNNHHHHQFSFAQQLLQQRIFQSKQNSDPIDSSKNEIIREELKNLLEDDEELASLETFSDYMPAKLKMGDRHPDQVVETASMASIPPPDIYYRLAIPEEVINEGRLSALQLESIIYASQQHENFLADGSRAGFLIGDGAGVGKGRTVAGIIFENYLRGRKRSLWFSVSNDLKYDAQRDLHDIEASRIEIHLLNKFKYGIKIHSPENDNVKRGVIFATYHSLIGESTTISGRYSSRFAQITQWCGEDFDGVIIFDECHKAKNLFPSGTTRATKTGQMVLELQRRLPKARVVYASATGATEPKNMGYMTRLGIWGPGTPFEDFNHFVSMVEKRGVGAMELVAIDLKQRGMYMARQLSFKGVQFRIEHVPLSREFIRIYNCCCRLWVSARTKFEKALDLMGAETAVSKAIWTQFWAAHQRFFKYLCIASKVKFAVALVKEALRCDKAVVIGLQSTGEARTLEQLEESGGELNDFVSTAKSVFQSLIERHFPAPNRKKIAKLLGEDTSFFDQFGIKLSRNANNEIVASYQDEEQKNSNEKKSFFDSENSDDDDDFISVDDEEEEEEENNDQDDSDDRDDDDESDLDSEELDEFDEIMDEKLGLKGNKKDSSAIKFMDILFGPTSSNAPVVKKRKKSRVAKKKRVKRSKIQKKKKTKPKKSMKSKYEKFYKGFDNVGGDDGEYCERLRDELLEQLESFGERLPPNTLDELIDELGGTEMVAEMTGRKGRVVANDDGQVQYEARNENDVSLEMLNLAEKQRFMNDEKRVAIISEAASSGISLHADRRAINKCRRVHLTVELPWSADRAIQQFGRTHRSNQVSAPEYVFLISNLAGEKRFASIVAKRLESLGALTHGDRRATESRDLSQFNIDTKYGRQALEIVMRTIANYPSPYLSNQFARIPPVEPPKSYSGNFFEDCREGLAGVGLLILNRQTGAVSLEKDCFNINKFLNRLLGLEVELQNCLFKYFNETMDAVIKQAKRSGRYDSGIIDLSSDVGNVQKLDQENFIMKSGSGAIKIQLHTVQIDRGLNYDKAYNMYICALDEDDYFKNEIGFYVSNSTIQLKKMIFLAVPENLNKNKDSIKQLFRIYKPSLGLQAKYETKSTLRERGTKIDDLSIAQKLWNEYYEQSDSQCTHMLMFGRCRSIAINSSAKCFVGLRKRTYCILSGSVLTVWPEIEKAIPYVQTHKLQIVRLKTNDGLKYIGPMVPPMYVNDVRNCLTRLANK